ncbi:myosin-10-like isoform X1 [Triticum dicoccoides]|uniref:myosin-10-like isoform X1 n=1 Tax=Triticum dicoccoides TaxID=85692 RepID=UPI0018916F5B|nr:myosin-10-like isoform X1 [Triticum dicoccoides]
MEAEAAALSQLQLQLLALVSELRLTRERERAAREELHASSERWKAAEEERRREARELRAELAARDEALQRLESRVKCLENENELLERNEKDLKENIERLLQSREAFMRQYEDSACSLQWTIQMRDKQITVISEKLNSHLALFNSVGKEVAAVKQVLGDVECLVGEKENLVSDLKCKVQRISVLEKDFVEKLSFLGDKITSYQLELRNRARIIYGLKEQLDAEKLKNNFHPQLEELKKSLLVKDEIIERLISDKQEMLVELHNMETALQKFQDIFSRLGHEEMKSSLPVSESQDCKVDSIPGSQVDLPNEDRMIPIIDETGHLGMQSLLSKILEVLANANVECKSEIDTGSNQVQSPPSLKHYALPCSEPVTANVEKSECPPESEDIEMGNSSPEQQTHSANPDPEVENQS